MRAPAWLGALCRPGARILQPLVLLWAPAPNLPLIVEPEPMPPSMVDSVTYVSTYVDARGLLGQVDRQRAATLRAATRRPVNLFRAPLEAALRELAPPSSVMMCQQWVLDEMDRHDELVARRGTWIRRPWRDVSGDSIRDGLDGYTPADPDLVTTLLDFARAGDRESFVDLARMRGVPDTELPAMWDGTCRRLGREPA